MPHEVEGIFDNAVDVFAAALQGARLGIVQQQIDDVAGPLHRILHVLQQCRLVGACGASLTE